LCCIFISAIFWNDEKRIVTHTEHEAVTVLQAFRMSTLVCCYQSYPLKFRLDIINACLDLQMDKRDS